MYPHSVLLFGAAVLGVAHARSPQDLQITAAPMTMVKRHIEVHQDYGAPIGVYTQYLTLEGSTTKVPTVERYHLLIIQ